MKGICKLYLTQANLSESHIFPKFVIKQTKATGSSYLRNYSNPNERMQDGPKRYLLSQEAEQEFSKREKWFSEKIYVPYNNGLRNLEYDQNLHYFALSLLWRVVLLNIEESSVKDSWYYAELLRTAESWRKYLADPRSGIPESTVLLMPTERMVKNETELPGIDYYMTRALDGTIVDNSTKTFCAVYGKFNRFIFWGIIKDATAGSYLSEVTVNALGGTIMHPYTLHNYPIQSFFQGRIQFIEDSRKRVSQTQMDLIEREVMRDVNKFKNSDLGDSLSTDVE